LCTDNEEDDVSQTGNEDTTTAETTVVSSHRVRPSTAASATLSSPPDNHTDECDNTEEAGLPLRPSSAVVAIEDQPENKATE